MHRTLNFDPCAFLGQVPDAGIRTLLCADVQDTLARIAYALLPRPGANLITIPWQRNVLLNNALRAVVVALAHAALARWPEWYAPYTGTPPDTERVLDVVENTPGVNEDWLGRAIFQCTVHRPPIPSSFPRETTARQLALALHAEDLVLCFPLEDAAAPPEHLHCFARAAEWAARVTGARVVALVPAEMESHRELDSILYEARHADAPAAALRQTVSEETPKTVLPPIIGHPHPNSPGEQLLAEALRRDTELAGRFEFNQPLEFAPGERYVVDLLWREGKLVVEVDGYRWHSTVTVFSSDRYRDYRLMINDYLVLRLPHDEVMEDVALQVEKIRDTIRFIERRGAR